MANLTRLPFFDIDPLRRQMERLVDDFFGDFPAPMFSMTSQAFRPTIDIYENDRGYEVICEVPGMDANDIELQVHQNTLVIRGQRKESWDLLSTKGAPVQPKASAAAKPTQAAPQVAQASQAATQISTTQPEVLRNNVCLHAETRAGSFGRTIQLPSEVDKDKVQASYKNGLLHIFLPKLEQSKFTPIQIQQ